MRDGKTSIQYKIVFIIIQIIVFPIKLPLVIINTIGNFTEYIIDWIDGTLWDVVLSKFYYKK